MKRILGLDLGTTSIGWALVNEAENQQEESSIVRLGVRVNPISTDERDNFEKGKAITTNSERTLKRGMRRNLQRYKLRRARLIDIFKREGWIDSRTLLSEDGKGTTFETINLRAKAAEEPITLAELARVLLNINKRRGYKSNRKTDGQGDNASVAGVGLAMELNEKGLTPGEYVYGHLKKGEKFIIPQFFRSDLENEFDRIWDFQKAFYPELTDSLRSELSGCNRGKTWTVCSKHLNVQGMKRTTKRGSEQVTENFKWRASAVREQLGLEELVIVFQEINAAVSATESYLGEIRERSKELAVKDMTVGQINASSLAGNPNESLRNKTFYRNDYMLEFDRIWAVQSAANPGLTPELRKEIRAELFYQRPLKSQKGLVSLCELESWKAEVEEGGKKKVREIGFKVAPKSSPVFQEFRIWQRLNDLTISGEPLIDQDKRLLYSELSINEKLTDKDILGLLKAPKGSDVNFKSIDGNRTMSRLYKAYKDILEMTGHDVEDFDKRSAVEARGMVESVFEALGYRTDILDFNWDPDKPIDENPLYRLWHLLYSYEGDASPSGQDSLVRKIGKMCNMDRECAKRLSEVVFEDDYASLSSRAMCRILPWLYQGQQYSDACLSAGYNHSERSLTRGQIDAKVLKDHVETLPKNSLRNPVVEKILNQMVNVVNGAIDEYGKPDEVRIELAREMKQSAAERERMTKDISEASRRNDELVKELVNDFHIARPTKNDITRYRLYKELAKTGYHTLYSNTYIPREELFGNKFDIEHIIPKARLFDDSFSNKTIEAKDVNIAKGNQTAIDYVKLAYGSDPDRGEKAFRKRVEDLYRGGIISRGKRNKLLMTEKEIPEDFIERDLRNTQYIAKKAIEMLEEAVRVVVPTTGTITKRLREDWQLINILKELNQSMYSSILLTEEDAKAWSKREDHRHHAMDALAIAFTKRQFVQYLNTLNASPEKRIQLGIIGHNIVKDRKFLPPMPLDKFRADARKAMADVLISIKAKNRIATENINKTKKAGGFNKRVQLTPRGQLHKETLYGTIRRYETKEVKVNQSLTLETISTVASPVVRAALEARLNEFGGNPKKAFSGKNSVDKNPIWIDDMHTAQVPAKVKTVELVEYCTVRTPVAPDLKIDKVVDEKVKRILSDRLAEYGNNAKTAFGSLETNPIWLNKEKGIAIKSVTIFGPNKVTAIHKAMDKDGNVLKDEWGRSREAAYVQTRNNHHAAIFEDEEGHLQEHIVSLYEALARVGKGLNAVEKDYNADLGWKFLFTMKSNEYFVFPNPQTGFDPNEINLMDPKNRAAISPNLFRVQKLSNHNYVFRHHLDTTTDTLTHLKDIIFKTITVPDKLKGIVKIRINNLGEIVAVGEEG